MNSPQQILSKNFPGVPIHDDVKTLDPNQYGTIDIITGGYPCQPFSTAGHKRGEARFGLRAEAPPQGGLWRLLGIRGALSRRGILHERDARKHRMGSGLQNMGGTTRRSQARWSVPSYPSAERQYPATMTVNAAPLLPGLPDCTSVRTRGGSLLAAMTVSLL